MDEQVKETEETQEKETSVDQKAQKNTKSNQFLLLVGGLYLLYTGFSLCKNVLEGQEGAVWGFFAAGAVFILIAAGMLYTGIKNYISKSKAEASGAEGEEGMEDAEDSEYSEDEEDAEQTDKTE